MKKIGEINVLGRIVPILTTNVIPEGTENFWAYYDIINRIIVINDTIELPDRIKTEILYHEICHAYMDRVGFNATSMGEDTHELICEMVRSMIADNFDMKNGKILKALLKKKPGYKPGS